MLRQRLPETDLKKLRLAQAARPQSAYEGGPEQLHAHDPTPIQTRKGHGDVARDGLSDRLTLSIVLLLDCHIAGRDQLHPCISVPLSTDYHNGSSTLAKATYLLS